MFGWNFRKSLKEKLLDKKLIEVKDNKINLLNCKDVDTLKVYESCFNRKMKRIALANYFKDLRIQVRKDKQNEAIKKYKKAKKVLDKGL